MDRGTQATVRFLGRFLSPERAEETDVFMQDLIEKRAASGEPEWSTFLSCSGHLLSAVFADQWCRLCPRKTPVTWLANTSNSAMTSSERFLLYRGEAALGVLMGLTAVWFLDQIGMRKHGHGILSTDHDYWAAAQFVLWYAIGMLARCAYKRREFQVVAVSYAAFMGALAGMLVGVASIFAMNILELDTDVRVMYFGLMFTSVSVMFGAAFNTIRYLRQ